MTDNPHAIALGGILQTIRAQRGQSVENMAVADLHIGHMTLRRLEAGHPVRQKTYAAVDTLLDVPVGTVKRALNDDLAMVELIAKAGVDTSAVTPATAAAFVRTFAAQTSGTHNAAGANPHTHRPAPGSDLQAVANVLNRLAQRPPTPRITAAVMALLDVMPDLLNRPADAITGDPMTATTTADELLAAVNALTPVERAVLTDKFTKLSDDYVHRSHSALASAVRRFADLIEDRTAGCLLTDYVQEGPR